MQKQFLQKSDVSPGVAEGKACAAADLSSLIASNKVCMIYTVLSHLQIMI